MINLGEQWGGQLDDQDGGKRRRGRPLSDPTTKGEPYHAVKVAHMAHLIKVDLASDLFDFSVNEDWQPHLERPDGKLLMVTIVVDD